MDDYIFSYKNNLDELLYLPVDEDWRYVRWYPQYNIQIVFSRGYQYDCFLQSGKSNKRFQGHTNAAFDKHSSWDFLHKLKNIH